MSRPFFGRGGGSSILPWFGIICAKVARWLAKLFSKVRILLMPNVVLLFRVFVVIVPLLVAVAFITLGERKALGPIQGRVGPNVVGF